MRTYSEEIIMAKAATHQGHCQLCGRLQLLPGGKMAKHGYTVECRGSGGWFSGVCPGSNNLPFEQSIALIETHIKATLDHAESMRRMQATLRQPATETEAYVHHYFRDRQRGTGEYRWVKVAIQIEPRIHASQYNQAFYELTDATRYGQANVGRHPIRVSEPCKDALAVASYLNARRADSYDGEIKSCLSYVEWQRARTKDWKPTDLTPCARQEKPKLTVGMTVRIGGKNGSDETIIAIEDRTCRGCGPFLNGQILPHAVFAGQNGKTWAIPVRSIRLPKVA
jgi:hypothetical protein